MRKNKKTAVEDILGLINALSPLEIDLIKTALLESKASAADMDQLINEERFSGGLVCPLCGCMGHIVRNGHREDGKQRYFCKDCGKSFLSTTNSIASGSSKELNTWKRYIECMINKMPYRQAAMICKIHRNTAFKWRHKILDALHSAQEFNLEGIIEADETFFPVSFKGNHNRGSFKMPRKAHKRGHSIHTRGLSKEQVCVSCAVDRSNNYLSMIAALGRITTKDLHLVFDGKIKDNSTLCTDKMNSYVRFAKSGNINLIQLKTGKSKKGIYHIQHINAYHSELKRFMKIFKGVATKYLNNYLLWHNWINVAEGSLQDRVNSILRQAVSTRITIKCSTLSRRPAIPLPN